MATNQEVHIGPEEMSKRVGTWITRLAFGLPLLAVAGFGYAIGTQYTTAAFAIIWSGIFLAATLRFVRKRTFLVVERFGKFWDVKFAGPRMLIPWIDNQVMRGDFLQKSVELYADMAIDFRDGTAAVKTTAWYQIGNPNHVDGKVEKPDPNDPSKVVVTDPTTAEEAEAALEQLREQVLRYTYRVKAEEREARVAEIFQGAYRPLLEEKKIEEAQKDTTIADKAVEVSRSALKEIGVYPFPGKGIILRDIVLPEAVIKFRQQKQQGEADAEEAEKRAGALWKPLKLMKEGLERAGINLTDEELRNLYMGQKGLDTVRDAKANFTFVSKDLNGVLVQVGAVAPQKGGTS